VVLATGRRSGSGPRVGPYEILRLVNRGGEGSVYLGFDRRLQRRVAIKIHDLPAERAARRALQRQAQLLAGIQSPRIVQIHDVIESSSHLAMVMEYVPGCDLEEFLGAVRPSLAAVLTVATDVAGALTVARQHRIVHGDLKPRNVLITVSGRAKLTDFGIARNPGEALSRPAASASALAPEQLRGEPVDSRTDLFALGCLLYRMIAGVHPFLREGRVDRTALLDSTLPPLTELAGSGMPLPGELSALVSELLQPDPRQRPAGTSVVRQALRRAARDIPLAAGNSLREEARPCFRGEAPEDLPPAIPANLGREGRSRLPRPAGWPDALWRRLGLRDRLSRLLVVVGLVLLVALPLVPLLEPRERHVHIAEPELALGAGVQLPAGFTARWLVEQVVRVVEDQLAPVYFTGAVGVPPRTTLSTADLNAQAAAPSEGERLRLTLRCIDLLCVLAIQRRWQGRELDQRALLYPDLPVERWRDTVREAAASLYR